MFGNRPTTVDRPVAWSLATFCRRARSDVPPRASERRCLASWRLAPDTATSPASWDTDPEFPAEIHASKRSMAEKRHRKNV